MENEEDFTPFVPLRKKLKRISTGKEDNFVDSYYQESDVVRNRTEQEIEQWRKNNSIEVEGENVPKPVFSFEELNIPVEILNKLFRFGYRYPTPIQMQTIPCVLSGRDLIGLAETGTGKTLCYVLPLLVFLRRQRATLPGEGPLAVILAPTRELVDQIQNEIDHFLSPDRSRSEERVFVRRSIAIVGGMPITAQLRAIRGDPSKVLHVHDIGGGGGGAIDNVQQITIGEERGSSNNNNSGGGSGGGVDVIVATPGRLLDLLERLAISFDRLSYLVFDEVDRMLSMNMEEQLRKLVGAASICARQTLMFTATLPISVDRLARSAVLHAVTVSFGDVGSVALSVKIDVLFTHTYFKKMKLLEILRCTEKPPVIVFCNSHYSVDKVVELLRMEQFHVAGIHSAKPQSYRFRVMHAFKEGQVDVLVCSDVISRGIDVPDLRHVILYDMPETMEDFIHRSGRTGRFGKEGKCTAFLTYECKFAKELHKYLEKTQQPIPRELEELHNFGGEIIKTEFGDRPKGKAQIG